MTLTELMARLGELDDTFVIYAEPPWGPESRAVALRDSHDGVRPADAIGTFLTSVAQAKRAVAARRSKRPDLMLNNAQACEAVIYFARYDEDEPLASVHSGVIRLPFAV
jgi:hypothetical protein